MAADLTPPAWWVEPATPGEYGILNVTTGHVDELHTSSLHEAAELLQTVREAIPALIARLAAQEASGAATPQLRQAVRTEQAARYRVVYRTVQDWKEVK